jgi:hypothetical protein
MTNLGTAKKPAVVRVPTQARAEEILAVCDRHGWKVIVGVEPDQDEEVSEVDRLLWSGSLCPRPFRPCCPGHA